MLPNWYRIFGTSCYQIFYAWYILWGRHYCERKFSYCSKWFKFFSANDAKNLTNCSCSVKYSESLIIEYIQKMHAAVDCRTRVMYAAVSAVSFNEKEKKNHQTEN